MPDFNNHDIHRLSTEAILKRLKTGLGPPTRHPSTYKMALVDRQSDNGKHDHKGATPQVSAIKVGVVLNEFFHAPGKRGIFQLPDWSLSAISPYAFSTSVFTFQMRF